MNFFQLPTVFRFCMLTAILISLVTNTPYLLSQNNLNQGLSIEHLSQQGTNTKWSNTTNHFAFTNLDGNSLYIANSKDEEVNTISIEEGIANHFEWSPDDAYIAFRTTRFEENRRVQSIKVYTCNNREIITIYEGRRIQAPRWIERNGDFQLILVTSGNNITVSEQKFPKVGVSSIKNKAVVSTIDGIFLITDEREQKISDNGFAPSLSSDLSLLGYREAGRLLVLNLTSGQSEEINGGGRFSFSPDGNSIVYQKSTDDGYDFISSDLFIYDLKTGLHRPLIEGFDAMEEKPDWSRTNSQIIYNDLKNGQISIISWL